MKNVTIALALAAAFAAHTNVAMADHGNNFHCSGIPFVKGAASLAVKRMSHNKTMTGIIKDYAQHWETEEIRRVCDAAAAGKPADFSCFQGRRDWDAIRKSIPEEFFGMSAVNLRPHFLAFQKQRSETQPRKKALDYCEGLGVIYRKVKG